MQKHQVQLLTSTYQSLYLHNDILVKLVKHIIVLFFPLIWALIHKEILCQKENYSWTQMHIKPFQPTTFHKL